MNQSQLPPRTTLWPPQNFIYSAPGQGNDKQVAIRSGFDVGGNPEAFAEQEIFAASKVPLVKILDHSAGIQFWIAAEVKIHAIFGELEAVQMALHQKVSCAADHQIPIDFRSQSRALDKA